MTGETQRRRSLFEMRAASLTGMLGLAAAAAAANIARLLVAARDASGLSHKQIAERLDVTEGRVSQVINGDGNVHVATAARFLRAMGYRLEVSAIPSENENDRAVLHPELPARQTRLARSGARDYEVYEQTFLTADGVMRVPMLIPADDMLRTVPYGRPAYAGRLQVSTSDRVRRVPPVGGSWQSAIEITASV